MRAAPLREVRPEELEPVLQEEVGCWARELSWDYRQTAEMIRRCVSSRCLEGQALRLDSGRVVGYCYHVRDGEAAAIGNVYVAREQASLQAYETLILPSLNSLRKPGCARRVECQLVTFNCDPAPIFLGAGFRVSSRRFLTRPLSAQDQGLAAAKAGSVAVWSPRFLLAAAEVMRDSYRDSEDYELCIDYQSLRGCRRFLRNLIENAGCGTFCPNTSFVGLDDQGDAVAVLLASRVGSETAMIPQLSVRRERQRQGWGSLLLRNHFAKGRQQGLARTVLCVSDANLGALRLYRKLGFQDLKTFQAFVWESSV